MSGTRYPRHEARLLEHSATEIVLDLEPRPLRIPVAAIDTLWERRTASKTGALVGGLLGAGIGVLVATQAIEEGETPSAGWVGVFAIGGAVGGGLLGALVGRAFPKWHRLYTR
jgi:MFS family permease